MRWLRKLTPGTLATFAVILAGLWLCRAEPPLVRQVRNAVFDQFQRWQPRAYEAAPVRIIDIDAESLKRIGQWPWPRTVVADLVMRLQDAGAVAISFDMMFAEISHLGAAIEEAALRRDAAAISGLVADLEKYLGRIEIKFAGEG